MLIQFKKIKILIILLTNDIAHDSKWLLVDTYYAFAYDSWGGILRKLGDHKGAIVKYKKAVEVDPYSASAYDSWGSALSKLGNSTGAIAL